jgi:glycosyltransferase involved in cell wall biosynthesis
LERKKWERRSRYQDRVIRQYTAHGLETARIFAQAKVQLVHAHMLFPNLLLAATAAQAISKPLVVTIHSMLEFRILQSVRARYPGLSDLVGGCIPQADAVVAVSDEIAQACAKAGARRIEKLPCGIDTDFFRLKSEGEGKDLLFVGTVRQDKGALILIRAFERICGRIQGNLIFIGKRLIRGPVFERARRHPRIRFLGVQPAGQILQRMRQAKMVILPSASEGLPLSVLEAMACGKPVVVTPTGELTDLIQNGDNGFLLKERTPAALARNILAVWNHPDLAALGAQARRTALKFDLDRTVERYQNLYQELI